MYFSLEPGDFVQSTYDGPSEGLRKMIARSPEYVAATAPKKNGGAAMGAAVEAFEDLEDSIPF
jgi:hypothetical protein